MAEQPSGSGATGKLAGWLKGLVTSALGLCSGAVLMYVSPLIDRVVKPAKPVANFAAAAQGLQVTFQNRSTGGTEGWWDFGDGSALEPYVPTQGNLTHAYAKPGTYSAKLTLKNLIGDESDRTVSVSLNDTGPAAPSIDAFAVVPLSPSAYAPATFRVVSKVKNADLCVWALGENRPLEISTDVPGNQDRIVTFQRPGTHAIRLAVFNGKQAAEKSETIRVNAAPAGTATAVLKMSRQAVQVVTLDKQRYVAVKFPANSKATVESFTKEIHTEHGFVVKGVQVVDAHNASGVKAQVSADSQKITLTGLLQRPTNLLNVPVKEAPQGVIILTEKLQKTLPVATCTPDMVAGTLSVPGSALLTVPRLPPSWVATQETMTVELHDGDQVLWRAGKLPVTADVVVHGRPCHVSATLAGEQVRVDVTPTDARLGFAPVGN
jgi:PKD repeat protein